MRLIDFVGADASLPEPRSGATVEACDEVCGEDEIMAVEEHPAIEADPLVGRVLDGRFRIVERIGAGGMGRVYKAVQAPLDRTVALKVVIPNYSEGRDPNFYKRFFLEASVTSKLSHPNTITIFDYGKTDDGLVYIAMEHCVGRTLSELVATEGPLPPQRAVYIAAQVARSLREAHGMGVIHRDLKPANIMLLKHGEDDWFVKVLDFGLVKFFGAHRDESPDAEDLTVEGSFVGSPKFMAPEQTSKAADQRADVYSLGVVLYYMLAGRPPYRGDTVADTIIMHMRDPIPPIQTAPDKPIPPDLIAILHKAMGKKPADRFQSMAELLDALKRCSAGELSGRHSGPDLSVSSVHAVTPPPLPKKRAGEHSASHVSIAAEVAEPMAAG
jgi:eukaryotic-like serine/threonine-protein kinase